LTVINFFNTQGGRAVNNGLKAGGASNIPLTIVTGTKFIFTKPADAIFPVPPMWRRSTRLLCRLPVAAMTLTVSSCSSDERRLDVELASLKRGTLRRLMTELLKRKVCSMKPAQLRRLTRDPGAARATLQFLHHTTKHSSPCSPGPENETTDRLIGWTGKVLAEHLDQRRQIAQNRR
jgi:hypothetical protein